MLAAVSVGLYAKLGAWQEGEAAGRMPAAGWESSSNRILVEQDARK